MWKDRAGTERVYVGMYCNIELKIVTTSMKTATTATATYGFFDLSLVRLDLLLQAVDLAKVPFMGLLVFVTLHCQVLEPPVLLPEVLLSLRVPPLLVLQLDLQLPYALFQPLDRLFASLQGVRLSLVKSARVRLIFMNNK